MPNENTAPCYYIWGIDQTAYGPVELPGLVAWVKEERVLSETWVFAENSGAWTHARHVPELKMFFRAPQLQVGPQNHAQSGVPTGALRRVKIFADMEEEQLATLSQYVETLEVRPFTQLLRRGETGADALYGVLEGELRSSILIEGKEHPLATLGPGSIFGEISFIDRAPHTTDVLSNTESVLVKFTTVSFDVLMRDYPELALAFALALTKSLSGRVRILTRRFEEAQLGQAVDRAA